MARADRQEREFRNLAVGIAANDLVREQLEREERREEQWRWVKRNLPLTISLAVLTAVITLFFCECLGWL